MSYKTVVAYARSEPELKRVLSAVGLLQQKMADIHVIGIYSIPSPMVYADPNGFIDPGMFELHDKQHKELSEHLKSLFEDEMRRRKARYEFRVARSETGTAADGVLATCLGAELLVAGQPDPDDPSINDETADTLVFHSSCPVLLVPYAPVLPATSLDRIVVAYNGKREASRAAFDALPLLRRASRTDVVWVDPPEPLNDGEAHASTDLVEALARHGIKAKDEEVLSLLDKAAVSYQIVLTKTDKIKAAGVPRLIEETLAKIKKRPAAFPTVLATSSEKAEGLDALREAIVLVANGG